MRSQNEHDSRTRTATSQTVQCHLSQITKHVLDRSIITFTWPCPANWGCLFSNCCHFDNVVGNKRKSADFDNMSECSNHSAQGSIKRFLTVPKSWSSPRAKVTSMVPLHRQWRRPQRRREVRLVDVAGKSRSEEFLQEIVGAKLTEANFPRDPARRNLGQRRNQGSHRSACETRSRGSCRTSKVLETGKKETRSGYGSRFRVELNAGVHAKKKKNEVRPDDARGSGCLHTLQRKKTRDRGRGLIQPSYMTFGAAVLSFGGWPHPPAISGATTACLKCLAMESPWVKTHQQSGMARNCERGVVGKQLAGVE